LKAFGNSLKPVVLTLGCLLAIGYVEFLAHTTPEPTPGAPVAETQPAQAAAVQDVAATVVPTTAAGVAGASPKVVPHLWEGTTIPRAPRADAAGKAEVATETQRSQVAVAQGGSATTVSADLPAFAPPRVVLTFPRDDEAAAGRTAALQRALKAAKVEVGNLEVIDASRPAPRIGYYFRSDRGAAVDVSRKVEPLLGPIDPVMEPRGKDSSPGTIVIALSGRGTVSDQVHRNRSNKLMRHVRTSDLIKP
jgi:hypothetical protein